MSNTLTLAAVTALATHITAHPHLDQLRVYHVQPAFEGSSMSGRITIRLFARDADALTELATWAATLTNPVATAEIIEGAYDSTGHINGWVNGELTDGTPVHVSASIPAGIVPLQPGHHPLPLPALAACEENDRG